MNNDVIVSTDPGACNGPFNARERELLQRSIEGWIEQHRMPDIGFDIAVCAWQEIGEVHGDPQILAAMYSISSNSTPADLREFEAQKEALKTTMLVYSLSVQNESDIYCARIRDDYRSQPLILMLNCEGGRFMVCLTTWFNYVSVGKTVRFLEYVGNLLCQMRPEGQGKTPMFCPELPELDEGQYLAKR